MTLTLHYTTARAQEEQYEFEEDAQEEQYEFEEDVTEIILSSHDMWTIDLTPLASCPSLQTLNLGGTQLQGIDLTPLASCPSLQTLDLRNNRLQGIDLTPSPSMQTLYLEENQLQRIDLTPLAASPSLQELYLGDNQLQDGETCAWLRVRTWDATYHRPVDSYEWSFLHRVAAQFGTDRRVQQDLLVALGLGSYGFIDRDLQDTFLSHPPDTPLETVREAMRQTLCEEVVAAVDRNGATTGLRLEEWLMLHGEIAKRVQEIEITKRAQEIIGLCHAELDQVMVRVQGNEVDLRELWVTAYGYEVLTALGMGLTADVKGLEQVKSAIAELGCTLRTGESSVPGVRMSDGLREAIWWIAENRGRPWSDIAEEGTRS